MLLINAVLFIILGVRVRGWDGNAVRDALGTHEEHALQDSGEAHRVVGGRHPPPSPWMDRSLGLGLSSHLLDPLRLYSMGMEG